MPKSGSKHSAKSSGKITFKKIDARVTKSIRKARKAKEGRYAVTGDLVSNALGTSFLTADLTTLSQGTQIDQRLANETIVNYIWFTMSLANFSTVETKIVRLMIVREHQTSGVVLDTAAWTNLYTDLNFGDRVADVLSGDVTYPLNRKVVDVLYDKVITVRKQSDDVQYIRKKLKVNRNVKYAPGTSLTAPIQGRIYGIAHVCEADNGTSALIIRANGFFRVFFKDI